MTDERAWFVALVILLALIISFKLLAILLVMWLIYQVVKAL